MKDLTRKEAAILGMIADGKRIPEIAAEQGMGVSTVSQHLFRAKAKLGARTLERAVVLFDRGLRGMP